jgi:hypothetical protein
VVRLVAVELFRCTSDASGGATSAYDKRVKKLRAAGPHSFTLSQVNGVESVIAMAEIGFCVWLASLDGVTCAWSQLGPPPWR